MPASPAPAGQRARVDRARRRARAARDWRSGSRHESCDARIRPCGRGKERCLLQARPRAASRRWRWRWPSSSAASSSTPTPCRSIAICASSRRGRAPAEEARVPHRLYGHVDAAENYSVGRWCQDARRRLDEASAARPAADPGRRHRALFQGADAGAFGGAADAAGNPRRGAGALRRRGRGARCTPSWPAAIRRWRRG